jgi:hypothetical protein
MVGALLAGMVFYGVSGVAAASPAQKVAAPTNQVPAAQWNALKASLNADKNLTVSVTVSGGTRTYTYTTQSGSTFVMTEPSGSRALAIQPKMGLGGCGWFQLCVFLNQTDQRALAAGLLAAEGILLCGLLSETLIGCAIVTGVLAAAYVYIDAHGICSNNRQEQVEVLPFPGTNIGCV